MIIKKIEQTVQYFRFLKFVNVIPHQNIFVLSMSMFLLSACSKNIQLQSDEFRLNNYEFKGNKQISTENLELLIPPTQKPNRRILYLPVTPYVWFYNIGKNRLNIDKISQKLSYWNNKIELLPNPLNYDAKIEKKRRKYQNKVNIYKERFESRENWWMKNIGEPPAIITESAIKRTAKSINDWLYSKGFFDAKVSYTIDTLNENRLIKVVYLMEEKSPYLLDTLQINIADSEVDSLIKNHFSEQTLKQNERIDFSKIEAQKGNLEIFLKNHGYYNFVAKNHISVEIDTTDAVRKNYRAKLNYLILNPIGKSSHEKFFIDSVSFISADPSDQGNEKKMDTTSSHFGQIQYTFIGKKFPVKILDKKILIRPNQLYNASFIAETNRQLYSLDQFAFANIKFSPSAENRLRAEIIAPTNPKYTAAYNFDLNNINNILGGGASVSLRARNLISNLETTELGLRANLEGQPGLDSTTQRSRELGANFAINIPKILFFNKISQPLNLKSPKTQVALSFNNSKQRLFERQVFRLAANYSWQKSKFETIQISPFEINLINTPYKDSLFSAVLNTEQNLRVLYDPQFASSFNTSYLSNNQVQGKNIHAKYLRIFVESGGTLLNFLPNKDKINFIDQLFPLDTNNKRAYFRFIKLNVDFRKYLPINQKDSWAYRINIGIAHPYGKNQAMPFEKNFFIGGPNSIRAWRPRSLGPGSALGTTVGNRFAQQPGDIILESSIEYRKFLFRFIGNWNAGIFLDAGNVWKWYQIDKKFDQANFDWTRFYKEIALGTGAGIRLDLDYFIARFDWGIKVFDPARGDGQRFVLDELKLGRNNPYYPVFHFAIGYPF